MSFIIISAVSTKAVGLCVGPGPEKATLSSIKVESEPEFGDEEGCFELVESVEEDPFNTVRLKNICDFDIKAFSVINCSPGDDCEVFYFASGQESLLELEGVEEVVTDFDENPRPERFLEIAWAENGLMGQVWLSSTYRYDYPPAPPCDDVRTCQVSSTHVKQPATPLGFTLLALAGLFGLKRRRCIT
jgi:hypothetical protein